MQKKRLTNAAMFESYRSVACGIPKPTIPANFGSYGLTAYGYQISVTNDQQKLSDFVTVIVYNGTCLICGKDQQGKCTVTVSN